MSSCFSCASFRCFFFSFGESLKSPSHLNKSLNNSPTLKINSQRFQTNSAIHRTRNKNQLHSPVAILSCFQKSAYYAGINIFNSLPSSLTSLINEKAQFKVALKRYLITHSFYSVDEFLIFTNKS
jgi:hypothetical protein